METQQIATETQHTPQAVPHKRLIYFAAGQLIFKEGDFGASFYLIKKGTVTIAKETKKESVPLAELGPGDFFGETASFTGELSARSASAFAKTDVELESWHFKAIQEQTAALSPIMKLVAADMIKKLNHISGVNYKVCCNRQQKPRRSRPSRKPGTNRTPLLKLAGNGKPWNGRLAYRPLMFHTPQPLSARGLDVDISGLRFEAPLSTTRKWQHTVGSRLDMNIYLPCGSLEVYGEINNLLPGREPGFTEVRISFWNLSPEAEKMLHFFLES